MSDMQTVPRDSERTQAVKSKAVRQDSPDKVERAIRLLERCHQKGQKLADKFPKYARLPRPKQSSAAWFKKEGFGNDDSARKVRQFVDPKQGYSNKDLKRLIGLCRKHERALGFTFVVKLLSVSKEHGVRRDLESELIENGWSMQRFKQELLSRFGRRRRGGKRRHVPSDVAGMLSQLDQMSLSWLKWTQRAFEKDAGEKSLIYSLPQDIRESVTRVEGELRELQALIEKRRRKRVRKVKPAGT